MIQIIIILAVGGAIYFYFMKNKISQFKSKINIDFNQEQQNFETYRNELLEGPFAYLKIWMENKPVDSFTDAAIPQTTTDKVTKSVKRELTRSAVKGLTGVRMVYHDNRYIWVMSGEDLHLLSYNHEGELVEHLIFDSSRLSQANLVYKGIKKSDAGVFSNDMEEYLPRIYEITFNVDGQPLKYEILDRLTYVPERSEMYNSEKRIIGFTKCWVVGNELLKQLKAKYPNLNTPVAPANIGL